MAWQLAFGQQPSTTVAGAILSPAVTVLVEDRYGNLETGDNTDHIALALGSNPTGATLTGGAAVTVSGGVAAFPNLIVTRAGSGFTLAATAAGLAGSAVQARSRSSPQ